MQFVDATHDTGVHDLLPADAGPIEDALRALGFVELGVRHSTPPDPDSIALWLFGERDRPLFQRALERGEASRAFVDPDRTMVAYTQAWVDGALLSVWSRTEDGTVVETSRRPTRKPDVQWWIRVLALFTADAHPLWARRTRPGLEVELVPGAPSGIVARHRARVAALGPVQRMDMSAFLDATQAVCDLQRTRPPGTPPPESGLERAMKWTAVVMLGLLFFGPPAFATTAGSAVLVCALTALVLTLRRIVIARQDG